VGFCASAAALEGTGQVQMFENKGRRRSHEKNRDLAEYRPNTYGAGIMDLDEDLSFSGSGDSNLLDLCIRLEVSSDYLDQKVKRRRKHTRPVQTTAFIVLGIDIVVYIVLLVSILCV
jgi:hypothetical protein